MKGLLIFLAGCLVGGAVIAWVLWESEPPTPPTVVVAPAPPTPVADAAPVTDLDPAAAPPPGAVAPADVDVPVGDSVDPPVTPAAPPVPVPDLNAPAGDDLDSGDPDAALPPEAVAVPATPVAPDPAAATAVAAAASGAALVPPLQLPVQGQTVAALQDTYTDARGAGRLHDAIDIMAPTGTPVLAVADGRIAKLFTSVPGGLTIYQFDSNEQVAFYYAHLDGYADGLTEGMTVKQGDVIGRVGYSGNANAAAPHLHFAVFVLGPEKQWWKGTAINPYPLLRAAEGGR